MAVRIIVDVEQTDKGLAFTISRLTRGEETAREDAICRLVLVALDEVHHQVKSKMDIKSVKTHLIMGERINTETLLNQGGHAATEEALGEE